MSQRGILSICCSLTGWGISVLLVAKASETNWSPIFGECEHFRFLALHFCYANVRIQKTRRVLANVYCKINRSSKFHQIIFIGEFTFDWLKWMYSSDAVYTAHALYNLHLMTSGQRYHRYNWMLCLVNVLLQVVICCHVWLLSHHCLYLYENLSELFI